MWWLIQSRAPADDWDLWLRLSRLAPVGFLHDICARYRIHDYNESRNLLKMKRAEIIVLEDYLSDFKALMPWRVRYIAERKLGQFYRKAAEICSEQGFYDEARSYSIKAKKIYRFDFIGFMRNKLFPYVPRFIARRLNWYLYQLFGW